jgi:hypothetical protein
MEQPGATGNRQRCSKRSNKKIQPMNYNEHNWQQGSLATRTTWQHNNLATHYNSSQEQQRTTVKSTVALQPGNQYTCL